MFDVDELIKYLNAERMYNYAAAGKSVTKSIKDAYKTKADVYDVVLDKVARINDGKK